MSFSITTPQFRARCKTVTRRLGWQKLKPGQEFMAVVKGMGLKKGEKVERLGKCRCVSNRREPLNKITQADCIREGFAEMSPEQFIEMFCEHNKCRSDQPVSRIEFEYL